MESDAIIIAHRLQRVSNPRLDSPDSRFAYRTEPMRQWSMSMRKWQCKAFEGQLRNEHYRAISPARLRIAEMQQEMSADRGRIEEIGDWGRPTVYYRKRRGELAG